jgi:hypothetical protein
MQTEIICSVCVCMPVDGRPFAFTMTSGTSVIGRPIASTIRLNRHPRSSRAPANEAPIAMQTADIWSLWQTDDTVFGGGRSHRKMRSQASWVRREK